MTIDDSNPFPPTERGDEPVVPAADAYAAECLATVTAMSVFTRLVVDRQVVTHNPRWGDVWRADFETGDGSLHPLVNRIVCWRQDGAIAVVFAIGQDVSPL